MKKISTLLIASVVILTVNAQQNYDTAIKSSAAFSDTPIKILYSNHTTSAVLNNNAEPVVKKAIIIMPNAVTKDIKINFKTDKVAAATVEVLDENGKKMLLQTAELVNGTNAINIDNFHSLSEGTYTIQLITADETYVSTFMVWK